MKKFLGLLLLISLMPVLFASYYSSFNPEPGLLIVTTIFPLSELANEITAGQDEIYQLIATSSEVHDFQLRPSDLSKLISAHVLVRIGSQLEPWLDRIEAGLDPKQLAVVSFTEVLKNNKYPGLRPEDPHLWLDFEADQLLVKKLTEVLSQLNPLGAVAYQKNSQALLEKLKQLDHQYRQSLSRCSSTELVIAGHQAFGYLAARYGLNQISLTGLNPEAQPTPRKLQEIINLIRAKHIKGIFYESSTLPEYAREIAAETGARPYRLSTGVDLSKKEIQEKKSFLSLMADNLKILIEGLGCDQQDK
ncbi:MAG: zinc ABC transporter substrate-binding protein [Acidobacteriota bacterium]|nr:zinc ABC transporter substrate-binding protein [Acidobacteriota bacterium]